MKCKWRKILLGEVVTFKNGKKRPQEEGMIPVYGGNGVMAYTLKSNFTECVSVGRVGAYCGNVFLSKEPCWISDNSIAAIPKCDINIEYLYYLLKNLQLNKMRVGSGQPLLTQKILNSIEITIPNIEYQCKVACILKVIDDKINVNIAINKNLEEQAQTIFDSFYEQADNEVPFTSIIQILGGGTPKTKVDSYWNGDIPFFTPKDVGNPYTLSTEKTITSTGLENCNSRLYPINTTFVTARGTVGKVSLAGIPMAMNQSCYALAGNNIHPLMTYFYTLKTVQSLRHKASGAVFDAIVTNDFKTETINKLSVDVELNALSLISPMMDNILQNSMENIQLATLRDTLLSRLISGEIDVSNIEV